MFENLEKYLLGGGASPNDSGRNRWRVNDYLNLRDAGFADFDGRELYKKYGKIVQLTGNLLEAEGLNAA